MLLAFVSTDYLSGSNTTVQSVAGGGLTWVLVKRSNVQSGSSEIWRAYATSPLAGVGITATLSQKVFASITVMAFAGTDPSGTNGSGAVGATASTNASRGAPTGSLVTTRNSSWVFVVGNDFDNPLPRTPGNGQSLVHQYEPSVGDTYWVQMQNTSTPLSGTTVTINDTAPTGDRYNLAMVEVLPASGWWWVHIQYFRNYLTTVFRQRGISDSVGYSERDGQRRRLRKLYLQRARKWLLYRDPEQSWIHFQPGIATSECKRSQCLGN